MWSLPHAAPPSNIKLGVIIMISTEAIYSRLRAIGYSREAANHLIAAHVRNGTVEELLARISREEAGRKNG